MNWKDAVPGYISHMETELYVNNIDKRDYVLDCGLGTSPIGAPPRIDARWRPILGDISPYHYPSRVLSDSLCKYWEGSVKPEELIFANGSDTILVLLAKALGGPMGTILGLAPQFTDAPVHFELSGCKSHYIELTKPSFTISSHQIINSIENDTTLIYLDRPHNPTGQVIDLDQVRNIAERAEEAGALVIVDEAYGGYMEKNSSAVNLNCKNLICVRSFSKAWGLGAVRAGYAVVRDPLVKEYYSRVSPPFTVGALALDIVPKVLKYEIDFLSHVRQEVAYVKSEVSNTILKSEGFSIAPTDPEVSIMLVSYYRDEFDLYDHLMKNGIKTESGSGFLNLGINSVRLRVPKKSDLGIFKKLWREAVSDLDGSI